MNQLRQLIDRARLIAFHIRSSFWAIPALLLVLAALLSVVNLWLDLNWANKLDLQPVKWLDASKTFGIRELLSTTAAAILGVAGVSFSITIASLTLASQQFGPRLIKNFMQDRFIQTVLGFFVATFLYCMLGIQFSSVVSESASYTPVFTLITTLVLTVVDLLLLVLFIHNICVAIQVDTVITGVSNDLHGRVNTLFPTSTENQLPADALESIKIPFEQRGQDVLSNGDGYIQMVDIAGLVECASKHNIQVQLMYRAGDYIMTRSVLARVIGDDIPEKIEKIINANVIKGASRSPTQDMEYSIRQLVEIALRALSPGINDPFTAMTCIDRLGSVVAMLAERPELPQRHLEESGVMRVIVPTTTFTGLVDSAFNQIRQNAKGHVDVTIRLLEQLGEVILTLDSEEQIKVLHAQARLVESSMNDSDVQSYDREAIEQRLMKIERIVKNKRSASEQA